MPYSILASRRVTKTPRIQAYKKRHKNKHIEIQNWFGKEELVENGTIKSTTGHNVLNDSTLNTGIIYRRTLWISK